MKPLGSFLLALTALASAFSPASARGAAELTPALAGSAGNRQALPAPLQQGTDSYGYTLNDAVPMAWIDATGGTKIQFTVDQDEDSVLIPLPFNFPFYEQVYKPGDQNWILISVNGFLSVTDETGYLNDFINLPVPLDSKPDSVIAPFWDDLMIPVAERPQSGVYMLQGLQGSRRYVVIEWHQVAQWGNIETQLTFEVVLYDDGTVRFQYQELNGALDSVTVGIENSHGTDGLMYCFNTPCLSAGQAIELRRPAAGSRARFVLPYYSAFLNGRSIDLPNKIQNVGDLGTDLFDLIATSSAPDWQMSLCQGGDCSPLGDSNKNGKPDSGWLDAGFMSDFTLRVTPPPTGQPGDSTVITVRAVSNKGGAATWESKTYLAIPAAFAQAVIDPVNGTSQLLNSKQQAGLSNLSEYFLGKNLAMSNTPLGNYFYAWEMQPLNSPDTILEYTVLDPFGSPLVARATLDTHNPRTATRIKDRDPYLAVLNDGTLAIAFIRDRYNASNHLNANIFLAVRKADGTWSLTNLTNNSAWQENISSSAPFFLAPSLAVQNTSSGQRLVVSWVKRHRSGNQFFSQIGMALASPAGAPPAVSYPFPALDTQQSYYHMPQLTALPGGQTAMTFTRWFADSNTHTLQLAVFGPDGAIVRNPQPVPAANADQADTALQQNGDLAIAWHDPAKNQVLFTHLSAGNFTPRHEPVLLTSNRIMAGNSVSITAMSGNRSVLTWQDAITNRYLMYALVDASGQVITEPLSFFQGTGQYYFVSTSTNGQGNGSFAMPNRTYMSMIKR